MKFKFDSVNRNRQNALAAEDSRRIQNEIILAKQFQSQTGCSWTEAIKAAYRSLAK